MVVAFALVPFAPPLSAIAAKKEEKKCGISRLFLSLFNVLTPEREASVVASQTLLVYAPFAQRLNGECSSSLCIQL